MEISLQLALKTFEEKIPNKYFSDPNAKFLLQYLDEHGTLIHALYRLINIGLKPIIPDRRPESYSYVQNVGYKTLAADHKRYAHIINKVIYAIDPSRLNTAWAMNALNNQREHSHKHITHADPETFDYWNLKFDIIITLNPVRIKELLKTDGILVQL